MVKGKISKLLVLVLTFAMVFSTALVSASAYSQDQLPANQKAEIFGEFDFESTELTTVMVQLNEASIVEGKHKGMNQSKEKLQAVRGNVIGAVKGKITDSQVGREYDYLFSGFSLELPANEILQLATIPGIKAVYPSVQYTSLEVGIPTTVPAEAYSPMMLNSAPFIGTHEAWDMGYTGKGITVAVIDTGTDYTHPDLAHAYGDYKGWDFVDNDADPQEGPGQYHGTHVAGTVAANGLIKGIAPEANLLTYRVLGPDGGTTADVVAGIERAVQDGADVMNLSLGNVLNNPDWPTSLAVDWAMAEGVVAVVANGNDGPANWTVGSPAPNRRAISVGATQLPYNVYTGSVFTTEGVTYDSTKVMGFPSDEAITGLDGNTYEFAYVGLAAAEDFEGLDLTGKIALISRGAYAFVDKAENAKAAGAVGAIIFNHLAGEIPYEIAGMAVPTLKMTNADGQKMLAELAKGNNKVTFDINFSGEVGETIADFSSRGPAIGTWMIKPDVSAPGVNIVSTFPGNSYAALQGTSMASPHVAGAAAVLLQAHPEWTVDEVKAALMNTADNLYDPAGNLYPHNTQGAGSIRVAEAIETNTLVLPGSHSFGVFKKDGGKQVEGQSFTIKNLLNEAKQYSFDVEFNGNPEGIKVMTGSNIKVNGQSTQQVNFNVQVDASILAPGYYEGTIKVTDGVEVIDVPTILFVGEPDYPRVSLAGIEVLEEGYNIYAYLPQGAEYLDVVIYRDTPWGYVGTAISATDLPKDYNEFIWDGTIDGEALETGLYHVYVFAEKEGQMDYVYAGELVIE